jgi:hypothetical protein
VHACVLSFPHTRAGLRKDRGDKAKRNRKRDVKSQKKKCEIAHTFASEGTETTKEKDTEKENKKKKGKQNHSHLGMSRDT